MQIFNYRLVKIRLFFDTQHFCTFQKKIPYLKKHLKMSTIYTKKSHFFVIVMN